MTGEDSISALHDYLLLEILSKIPTKDAVTTMVLSKRWGLVWTMVSKLEYKDTSKEGVKSVWCLIDKSLQLHKAPVLESLHIQIGREFSDDADVGKCVSYAVDHNVRELALTLASQPKSLLLPSNVYTSKTLVKLTLASRTIVVDVPSLPCLPLLQTLHLLNVVFKDQSSHVRLLSNCPTLIYLRVVRDVSDDVTRFIVKVPSLKSFKYNQPYARDYSMPLVLDSPGLRHLHIFDHGDLESIQNMPHLENAYVAHLVPEPSDKFLRSFSSVKILHLRLMNVACCSAINLSGLMKFKLQVFSPGYSECSLEPLMFFLHNAPILKELMITYDVNPYSEDIPLSWNQQTSVPVCLLSHLQIFVWEEFGGRKRQERECVEFILANSKCLKTARISPRRSNSHEEKEKIVEELKSMFRVSASCQLITDYDSTNHGRGTT